jgi:Double zinc ribbon
MGSLHTVFHSTAFEIARNLALFLVALLWLGVAFWVHRDARRRIKDPWVSGTATLLGLVPIAGPLAYLFFRPPETLDDVKARRVELRALERHLKQPQPECPVCRASIEPSFLVCPVCTTQLKAPCSQCSAPLEPLWQACPYCATPVGSRLELATPDLESALTAEVVGAEAFSRGNRPSQARRASAS